MASVRLRPNRDDFKIDPVGNTLFVRGWATAVHRATGQEFSALMFHERQIEGEKILRHTMVVGTLTWREPIA